MEQIKFYLAYDDNNDDGEEEEEEICPNMDKIKRKK